MISVYTNWTEEEHDAFINHKFVKGDRQWWGWWICCTFKEEWTYEDLLKSVEEDLSQDLSLDEIKQKYFI
jgi:hypothetical protein